MTILYKAKIGAFWGMKMTKLFDGAGRDGVKYIVNLELVGMVYDWNSSFYRESFV